MSRIKKYIIFAFALITSFFICATTAFASSDDAQVTSSQMLEVSFEESLILMLENNSELKALEKNIIQKDFERKSAIGHYMPKVALNSTYMHFSEDMTVQSHIPTPAGTMNATTLLQNKDVFVAGGGIVWNIFTGGKILANHKASIAKLDGASHQYNATKNALIAELVKRYFGLILAFEVEKVKGELLSATKEHYDNALLLEKEGVIAKSQRLIAQVAFDNAKRDYSASLKDVSVAQEAVKSLIKADVANLSDVVIKPSSTLFSYEKDILPLGEFKKMASQNNPNLKLLDVKSELAKQNYRAKMAEFSPVVSLVAYDVIAQSQLSPTVPQWGVGATANFKLFDGLSTVNNLKSAGVQKEIVEHQKEDALIKVDALVTKQYRELEKYLEQCKSYDSSIKSAQEALRAVTIGFKEGFNTSLDVVDSQLMLSKVKAQRLQSIYNFDVTLCELLATAGAAEDIILYVENSNKEEL